MGCSGRVHVPPALKPREQRMDEVHVERIYLAPLNSLRAQRLEKSIGASAQEYIEGKSPAEADVKTRERSP